MTTGGSYVFEFWIKLDRINEVCKMPDFFSKKYYMIADPHVFYSDSNSLLTTSTTNANFNKNLNYPVYYQLLTNPNFKVQLKGFSQFNWNHVLIHVNTIKRTLRLVTNFNYYTPDLLIDPVHPSIDISLRKLVFCSSNSSCSASSSTSQYLNNIWWGAAFYKDLRLSDGINSNFFVSQEYINKS